MTEPKLSLLHIEDDSLWKASLAQALQALPGVRRIDSATDGAAGLALARQNPPDVVFLDILLPDCDGLHLAAELAELKSEPRVLLLSARRDDFVLFSSVQPHIAGLLWKGEAVFEQIGPAVAAVSAGEKYFSIEIREALRRFRSDPKSFHKMLSPRELAVLARVAHGESDAEIAAFLKLSEHTIRSHRQHIMQKLDLPSAARLIHWAITHGFGSNRRSSEWRVDEARG